MRAKSTKTGGYIVYAVAGTNTVSFAIDFRDANTKGLLGFAVERIDQTTGERHFRPGYKVFKSILPDADEKTVVSTEDYPVQSFVWDDFSCYPDRGYKYFFYPMKGVPGTPDLTATPVTIDVRTEPLYSTGEHDIFFNRGVASSQAYALKFQNQPPDKITDPAKKQRALDWLSRDLDDAILKFIGNAKKDETLFGCFYEFHYAPVLDAFKAAIDRGVQVKIIIDAKENETTSKKTGKVTPAFPRPDNLQALKDAGIPITKAAGNVIKREARKDAIQHNKFIVYLDKNGNEKEVWTGSTNISMGGIHGQTNVGHWVRNADAAKKYKAYWDILSKDPGGKTGDDAATVRTKNSKLKADVEALQPNIVFDDWNLINTGITPVFSPRTGGSMLESYACIFASAESVAGITLAFGINKLFKDYLEANSGKSQVSFLMLEEEDKANSKSKEAFRYIGAKQNVYKSWGAYIEDELYRWTRETSTRQLGLNSHVAYIHSKFMIIAPFSADPLVISGSANFSDASMNDNDENMIIVRGNMRVSDIYFTEFNRLFNHYYFRAVYNNAKENNRTDDTNLWLTEDDGWLKKYEEGKLRWKRVMMMTDMEGI